MLSDGKPLLWRRPVRCRCAPAMCGCDPFSRITPQSECCAPLCSVYQTFAFVCTGKETD